jgi:hypothetical protein
MRAIENEFIKENKITSPSGLISHFYLALPGEAIKFWLCVGWAEYE